MPLFLESLDCLGILAAICFQRPGFCLDFPLLEMRCSGTRQQPFLCGSCFQIYSLPVLDGKVDHFSRTHLLRQFLLYPPVLLGMAFGALVGTLFLVYRFGPVSSVLKYYTSDFFWSF